MKKKKQNGRIYIINMAKNTYLIRISPKAYNTLRRMKAVHMLYSDKKVPSLTKLVDVVFNNCDVEKIMSLMKK